MGIINPVTIYLFSAALFFAASYFFSLIGIYKNKNKIIDILILFSLFILSMVDYHKVFGDEVCSPVYECFNINMNGIFSTIIFIFSVCYYLRANKEFDNNKKCDNIKNKKQ